MRLQENGERAALRRIAFEDLTTPRQSLPFAGLWVATPNAWLTEVNHMIDIGLRSSVGELGRRRTDVKAPAGPLIWICESGPSSP